MPEKDIYLLLPQHNRNHLEIMTNQLGFDLEIFLSGIYQSILTWGHEYTPVYDNLCKFFGIVYSPPWQMMLWDSISALSAIVTFMKTG